LLAIAARAIELSYGHTRPAPTPHAVTPASGLLSSNAANSPIVPADFGADPTGAKDSTAAMQAAVAALLKARGPHHTMASNITDLSVHDQSAGCLCFTDLFLTDCL